jgi:uncharacterized protein (TIGR03437 family)
MTCAVVLFGAATAIASQAQTLTVLASFNIEDGTHAYPGPLVQGTDGNFYGLTEQSGANGSGTVFKITPGGTLTTLYAFGATSTDGAIPEGGLIQATDGNFYGTTRLGGALDRGTIFSITPAGTKTTLYSFGTFYKDGIQPVAGLIQATDGNFYGTTLAGGVSVSGASASGTVFKFTPGGTLTTLYAFGSTAGDGIAPAAALIQATDGNFYGTTNQGGVYNEGTVFKITPGGTLTTLCSFHPTGAFAYPSALIQAANGNFYGTTVYAPGGPGAVFELTPEGTLTMLYTFGATATDGTAPYAGLIQAADGNFYGTTSAGGTYNAGTIFEITPTGTETTLYTFGAITTDAQSPSAALIQATDGNFYGTSGGGAYLDGTVFRFTPASSTPPTVPAITASAGVVSGASFQAGIVPGSVITIFGTNLSTVTDTWSSTIVNGKLPTSLDGVTVMVGDQQAYPSYISATQINAVAPDVASGATSVTVTNSNGTSQAVMATVAAEQPAFFQWGNYAVATHQDYTYAVKNGTFAGTTTIPAAPGDVIILWGTGFGPTSPAAPAGMETPSTGRYNTASEVTVTVGNQRATVYGAALAPGYAGLYQVAIQIPALANGDYPVVATINGVSSPSTTMITVQK